jgi:spore germination cell wall hydrolase CwlJ-like protein
MKKTLFTVWAFAYFITQVSNLFGATLPPRGYTPTPTEVVAMTLLGEARGEGKAGIYAVATVISKRMGNRRMTAQQVCLEDWQFSCNNDNDKNKKKLLSLLRTHSMRTYAMYIAQNINRLDNSYTKHADHYCNIHANPYWGKGITPVVTIGNHKFYKLR